jgi:glyoxylase-like metal-dependent hydrolase (beta-lactamase superfamily II)
VQTWGAGDPTWRLDEVAPGLLQVSVPRSRAYVNVYAINNGDDWTLVDCAEHVEVSRTVLYGFLETSGILRAGVSQIFLTHGHPDHTGLAAELAEQTGATIVAHEGALQPDSVDFGFLHQHGFEPRPGQSLQRPLARRIEAASVRTVSDGDMLAAGPYRFRLLWTPGHQRGHLCGFDESSGMLISGDRVLRVPTGIGLYSAAGVNPLAEHLASYDVLRDLPVRTVLPGHGRAFGDLRSALERDRRAHLERVGAVLRAIPPKGADATALAHNAVPEDEQGYLGRDERTRDLWALGRTLAALRLLEQRGWITVDEAARPVRFHRTQTSPIGDLVGQSDPPVPAEDRS